jgi:phosphatidylglycerophosphate synthase
MSRPLTQLRFTSNDLDGVQDEYFTLSNGITLAGYILSLAWIAGGPAWMALAGLVADEIDGTIARKTNTVSEFGSVMDFTTDMIMTALVARRLGIFPILPVITAGQVYRRIHQVEALPPFAGARSLLTLATVIKERKTNPVFR